MKTNEIITKLYNTDFSKFDCVLLMNVNNGFTVIIDFDNFNRTAIGPTYLHLHSATLNTVAINLNAIVDVVKSTTDLIIKIQ